MWFPTNCPWVIIQQQYQRSQIYRSVNTLCLKWYIYYITIHINFKPVDTVYWSVYALRNIKSFSQVCVVFGYKPKCCMTTAWGGYCGLRFREVMLPTHSSESHYGSVLPMRAWCMLSFRMLRCCSTIISGQCFWEEQPRQRGNAGTVVVVNWRAAAWNGSCFPPLG